MQDILGTLEEKYGGSIKWKTFSIWYGDSNGNIREYGVLLFRMEDGLFRFHDYKHIPKFLGFEIHPKNEIPYEPFDGSFRAEDITEIRTVTKKDAQRSIKGGSQARKAGAIKRVFCETVTMVITGGATYYFEFPDKEFRKIVKDAKANK